MHYIAVRSSAHTNIARLSLCAEGQEPTPVFVLSCFREMYRLESIFVFASESLCLVCQRSFGMLIAPRCLKYGPRNIPKGHQSNA
jgi:hypothetical protein